MKRFALLLLLTAAPLGAAESPTPGLTDSHIQTVFYDPDQVVRLAGRTGYQTMIEFDPSERIENVAIGDALGWQVTPNKRANKLFLKPMDRRSTTNMAVVTDRRRYTFALSVAPGSGAAARAPWVVRFAYPQPAMLTAEPPPRVVIDPSTFHRNYTLKGAAQLFPSEVYDDGRATWFAWGPGVALPAIFAVAADGRESIVNSATIDGRTVVQQTAGRFVLRSGKAMATVTYAGGGK